MAQHISDRLAASYRFPRHPQLYLKIATGPLRQHIRRAACKVLPSPVRGNEAGVADVSDRFDQSAKSYRENGWAYVEEFWPKPFHELLIQQWPPDRYFDPLRFVTKSYDSGFDWGVQMESDPHVLSEFPVFKAAYKYLRSEGFCRRLTQLSGDGIERLCYQIRMTRSYWGSSIVPHIDSSNTLGSINLVSFIDGSGGPNGGGLGFWRDNEFKEEIFSPMRLHNTAVLYDMTKDFFHGFKPMRFGTFRWTINSTYRAK